MFAVLSHAMAMALAELLSVSSLSNNSIELVEACVEYQHSAMSIQAKSNAISLKTLFMPWRT